MPQMPVPFFPLGEQVLWCQQITMKYIPFESNICIFPSEKYVSQPCIMYRLWNCKKSSSSSYVGENLLGFLRCGMSGICSLWKGYIIFTGLQKALLFAIHELSGAVQKVSGEVFYNPGEILTTHAPDLSTCRSQFHAFKLAGSKCQNILSVGFFNNAIGAC